jgi:hypothetical protein
MDRTWIHKMREGHLVDAAKSLIKRMPNNFEYKRMIDGYKTMNRIVDYFSFDIVH